MNQRVPSSLQSTHPVKSQIIFGMRFDTMTLEEAASRLSERPSSSQFEYIVTPNVQHVVDKYRNEDRNELYANSLLCLCDSQPVRALAYFLGDVPPLVTGADLTVSLFENTIEDDDTISAICASEELTASLREKHPNINWQFHVPPANTDIGTKAFEECINFLIETPARFSFVCLGAPKSEEICHMVFTSKAATGTAICSGAALEFLVGIKKRAPHIFQRFGVEWVYRIMSEPRRLLRRYASAGPSLLKLFSIDLMRKYLPLKNNS